MALLRLSSFMILLAYVALIVLASLTPCWYVLVTHIEKRENLHSANIVSQFQSEIEYSSQLLQPLKSSSTKFSRLLSSTLNSSNITFSDVQSKVAPLLFQALETIPHLTQISYIELEGLFFSYYNEGDQILAMYSNSSIGSASNKTLYYIQPVNRESGEVYGETTIFNNTIDSSWINVTNNTSNEFASLGTKWSNVNDILFINSARINTIGMISLGFSPKAITDYVTRIDDRQGIKSSLATKDGKVILQGIQNTSLIIFNETVYFQSLNGNGGIIRNEGGVSCKDQVEASNLNIHDTQYLIHCHPIDLMGIESVYVLAVPQKGINFFDQSYKKIGLLLLIAMMMIILMAILIFILMNVEFKRREMNLCASLIKQMEATEQAERKNMNKSLAFANASHDLRGYVAGLIGLIEMSTKLLVSNSHVDTNRELVTNLKQMENCSQDLLGLLNSILDTSKIEAGKMQLEEEEFNVSYFLEDVVDFYYPMAMKKGVDLVLDPCNGSVFKHTRVKGDRKKLKQVLSNLLNNAVKFTEEGHITVRAWTQKPEVENSMIMSRQNSVVKPFSRLFCKKEKKRDEDIEALNSVQQDVCFMDFVFEVDDTGKGIPKEKYKSVFENYVQVKDNAPSQVGTGLGLGIVQSLVRLMHGDIEIVEKEVGKKGTCFKFNVLLTSCENEARTYSLREAFEHGTTSGDKNQTLDKNSNSGSSICSISPRLHISPSLRPEPSHVILYISNEERRRTSQLFIESLGIKVKIVKNMKHLINTLKKVKKQKGHQISDQSSADESSDLSISRCASYNSSYSRRVPLISMEGTQYGSSMFKKTNIGVAPSFVLIIIDANAGPFSKLCKIVTNFKKDLVNPSKVVWLEKPFENSVDFDTIDQEDDIVISKPFHGSRLYQVIRLLPEFGGSWKSNSNSKAIRESKSSNDESFCRSVEQCWKRTSQKSFKGKKGVGLHQGEIQECGDSSNSKPLSGKKFLIVDDHKLLRMIARSTLSSLGVSTIDQCENGKEAVRLVGEGLTKDSPDPPYDYILMDCQMPVMDGFEATRQIREMEKSCGFHIPIIALSSDIDKLTIETGMDFHITKPIKPKHLLKAITFIENNDIM